MKLKNKTVFITGGAKRIGREMAIYFAMSGANICLHYNNSKKEALSLKDELIAFGVRCEIYKADLTNTKQALKAFNQALLDFKKIEFLVNNASIFKKNSIKEITEEEFDRDFAIHAKIPLFLMQAFATQNFINEEGFVLNILDKNTIRRNTSFISYLLSKKSLEELTRFAAFELAPKIRVNAISPGFIIEEEEFLETATEAQILDYNTKKSSTIPLKRKGCVQDIIKTLDFLINTNYINGQNILVDGGSFLD